MRKSETTALCNEMSFVNKNTQSDKIENTRAFTQFPKKKEKKSDFQWLDRDERATDKIEKCFFTVQSEIFALKKCFIEEKNLETKKKQKKKKFHLSSSSVRQMMT